MITTPGRRTGIPRSTCVRCLETPAGLVVRGNTAQVKVREREFAVRSRERHGEAREAMRRNTILAEAPEVASYEQKAGHTIPVAVLEPE